MLNPKYNVVLFMQAEHFFKKLDGKVKVKNLILSSIYFFNYIIVKKRCDK